MDARAFLTLNILAIGRVLFVDLAELPCFYLNCSVNKYKTILGSKQVNSGKSREIWLHQQTISCHVLAELNKIWICVWYHVAVSDCLPKYVQS
jgi:hypothetical protein